MIKPGTIILATIQHWHTKNTQQCILIKVDEDDVDWRFLDDNAELSYDWNVIDYTTQEKD